MQTTLLTASYSPFGCRGCFSTVLRRTSAAFLALALTLSAQTTAPVAEPKTEDETLQLSPFEVSTARDTSYAASDTLAGGRTSMSLKFSPAAISAMTTQFLEDINATNNRGAAESAGKYTPA